MNKIRLDRLLVSQGLVTTRSQAEDLVKRGFVSANDVVVSKPGIFLDTTTKLHIDKHEGFVSRAGEKLNSVVDVFKLDFKNKLVELKSNSLIKIIDSKQITGAANQI